MFLTLAMQFASAQNNDQISYTTYYFNDSGNNSVVTSSFSLAKKLIQGTAILLDIELDKVTLPPAVDGQTGATRPARKQDEAFEKNRGQVIIGLEQSLGSTTTLAVNAYRSQELDYISNALVVTFSQELFQRNTTVTVRGQVNGDQVGELLENGDVINEDKSVYTAALNLTQVLSKNSVLNMSYDLMMMDGYLSDPYRKVRLFNNIGGFTAEEEIHPDTRIRQAVTSRMSQFINPVKASIIGSYRYYFDDWDVNSHTAEFRFNKYVFEDFIAGFNYRYYTQNGADFYFDRYDPTVTSEFRTADYKLMPFQSHTFGFNIKLLFRRWADNPGWESLKNSNFEVMYLRYTNDLDFSANILQATLNFAI